MMDDTGAGSFIQEIFANPLIALRTRSGRLRRFIAEDWQSRRISFRECLEFTVSSFLRII